MWLTCSTRCLPVPHRRPARQQVDQASPGLCLTVVRVSARGGGESNQGEKQGERVRRRINPAKGSDASRFRFNTCLSVIVPASSLWFREWSAQTEIPSLRYRLVYFQRLSLSFRLNGSAMRLGGICIWIISALTPVLLVAAHTEQDSDKQTLSFFSVQEDKKLKTMEKVYRSSSDSESPGIGALHTKCLSLKPIRGCVCVKPGAVLRDRPQCESRGWQGPTPRVLQQQTPLASERHQTTHTYLSLRSVSRAVAAASLGDSGPQSGCSVHRIGFSTRGGGSSESVISQVNTRLWFLRWHASDLLANTRHQAVSNRRDRSAVLLCARKRAWGELGTVGWQLS